MKQTLGILGVAALLLAGPQARAQTYPERPIRIIVPFPAGGVLDTMTRAIGEQARGTLGQPVIVENRAGAAGSIGLQACSNAEPDGYTFCAVTAEAMSVTPHLEPQMWVKYRSLIPVSQLVTASGVIYANPALKANTLAEALAVAKANPSQLNYSSWGLGTSPNLLFEWLKKTANVEITHVPYKGSMDALNDVVAGRAQLSYVALGFVLPQIEAGTLKPLAVIGDKRSPRLPNVPSLKELGYNFPYKNAWFALMAPPGTPLAIREKVAVAVKVAVNAPTLRVKFLDPQDLNPVGSTPQELERVLKAEYEHGAEIIRVTGIRKE
ncbi:MAG: tripartite tricarboxylate transporter substrate binding protein [Pseudolabrys sp.]|nr:tripartite tricarboxylate transporter substrate binding protein [Pseudolabrys sp.]